MRISGPEAFDGLRCLAPSLKPRARFAHRVRLIDPSDGSPLDDGLALVFPGPASFTGEDVVELHVHGSPAVLDRLFAVLGDLGMGAARPGAFTRRALSHGKLDLPAVEGLADLIDSDSDSQRLQALAQMGGAWARRVADWQSRLLDALAWLEASIDFADEDDVPDGVAGGTGGIVDGVAREIAVTLADGHSGEIIRDGLRVVIVGAPNVGKSTLLNALAGREAAIVSAIPGTTRDVVEVRMVLDGYVVVLADTAGLRETDDAIEAEGIKRARQRARDADLRIQVIDASDPDSCDRVGLETDDIVFWNKADLVAAQGVWPAEALAGSLTTGSGFDALLASIRTVLHGRLGQQQSALITRARHREALRDTLDALERSLDATPDLAAVDIRTALNALARLLGRFDVEQVLDRIFSSFCIGK